MVCAFCSSVAVVGGGAGEAGVVVVVVVEELGAGAGGGELVGVVCEADGGCCADVVLASCGRGEEAAGCERCPSFRWVVAGGNGSSEACPQ